MEELVTMQNALYTCFICVLTLTAKSQISLLKEMAAVKVRVSHSEDEIKHLRGID